MGDEVDEKKAFRKKAFIGGLVGGLLIGLLIGHPIEVSAVGMVVATLIVQASE